MTLEGLALAPGNFTSRGGRSLTLRPCSGFEELDACVELQIATWGYGDMDVVPRRLFLLAQKIGGQVIGAFDAGRLAGFAMALPAIDAEGRPYLHSHMLAVLPEYRDQGLGRALKLAQREDALARGIARMDWTFDPLEIKNAFLNIHKLGAVVRRYSPNFYGVSSSRLQAGLPTDRLHAEWWLGSPRVAQAVAGAATSGHAGGETIEVPAAAGAWKQQTGSDAARLTDLRELQAQIRAGFLEAFGRGLAIRGFHRDQSGNGIYQLVEWQRLKQDL